ncbi:RNase HI [Alkalithermobacter thermoalcaliphilus JW-YL-7 = DSM 7308]|uniref:Ribonuclease H n=1 Tax=Alkalithermobacter thermoalcaliphilus JW-YL-7 = DSM 7308 TaxID=1121328 RepID=A0A150FNQ9_CLOPD|nr:Ribonuclease H [[Clostridium] paradoxum JW-YL-7 = DSM 7308]SHK85173.1 RNase HI [[Clostridium] paradoxum JW-YL-7 = DSM 7308]
MNEVIIYTDGACLGNPDGPGGYGAVLVCKIGDKEYKKEISGGFDKTTNNRMELMAAIVALEALKKPCNVILYSDSKYIVDAINLGWVKKWKENSWYKDAKKKEKAKNVDLWKRLLNVISKHNVKFEWVKGHAGNWGNETCDRLAKEAALGDNLPLDVRHDT